MAAERPPIEVVVEIPSGSPQQVRVRPCAASPTAAGFEPWTRSAPCSGWAWRKVVLGTAAHESPGLITSAADVFGSQAVVVSVDARREAAGGYSVYVRSGSSPVGSDAVHWAQRAEGLGAGETLLNAIDRDGTMNGYDLDLIAPVYSAVSIPVVACGGAGERADLPIPVQRAGASAVAAGSLFVFQGRERGVLINFPEREQLEALFS